MLNKCKFPVEQERGWFWLPCRFPRKQRAAGRRARSCCERLCPSRAPGAAPGRTRTDRRSQSHAGLGLPCSEPLQTLQWQQEQKSDFEGTVSAGGPAPTAAAGGRPHQSVHRDFSCSPGNIALLGLPEPGLCVPWFLFSKTPHNRTRSGS